MPLKSEKHGLQLAAARAARWAKEGASERCSESGRRMMANAAIKAKILSAIHNPESQAKAANARRVPMAVRFQKYASPEPSGCWLWAGSHDRKGYGQLRVDGRLRIATHLALELDNRPRPFAGACARHKCDFPPCVNPDHLEWGTSEENTQDAVKRGRLNLAGLELGRGRYL